MNEQACIWCGAGVGAGEGFRAYEPAGGHRAVFCRLEHIVPWAMRGAHWETGGEHGPPGIETPPPLCSQCGRQLGGGLVLLVHHREAHRIADGFCGVEHMRGWAIAGGRWR